MAKKRKDRSGRYVGRGGDKLERALAAFDIDPEGRVTADLGANVGGFTDCLLQHGAPRVYAVETGYGVLDWKLRQDERVVVMERTNALHVTLPEPVSLVVADVGWTSVLRYVPHALGLLAAGGDCIALLKPQYEVPKASLKGGFVADEEAARVTKTVVEALEALGCRVVGRHDPELDSSGRNPEYFLRVAHA